MKNRKVIAIARIIGSHSYCKRLKVGAVILQNDRIISTGYNGNVEGLKNKCEEEDETLDTVLHAEQNALAACSKLGVSTDGAKMYVTHAPCVDCAKLIISCGIKAVYYKEEYRCDAGIKLLAKKIKVRKVK